MRKAMVAAVVLLATAAHGEIAGRATVIDGDTIEIHVQRIRLHGVDAPEKGQPCYDADDQAYRCGTIAASALDQFIGASSVMCRERDTGRYGRTVANCLLRGVDVDEWLVRNGYGLNVSAIHRNIMPTREGINVIRSA